MSQSERIQERFQRRLGLRRAASIVYLISGAVYLAWRLTILNENALWLSAMYYAADVIAVLLGAMTIFVSWGYRHRRSPPAPEGLAVDVFIPTYREPVDMVRRTLEAALAIRYPHQTWLLDDGNRPAMRALAAELGCRYLARTVNTGAKAGNLNHALAHSKAAFVAVFDADHIPQTHALDATLGFFDDPKVGMVQAPQDYYNVDALQYMNAARGGLWHDQSFFYNLSQPGRDRYDAASCAGTSVVYRRGALDEIGGIPEDTVTEDFHTSLKLQRAGFSAPYLNEPIAYGVAAADLTDYYRTRLRYGHGNIHVLRRERIFWSPGLTWRQRLSYLSLGVIYLEGWQQLMVFLVPAIALIFGIAPFEITILNVLIVLVYPLWSYLLMQEIGCGFSRYWTAEIYSMMRFPVHLLSAAALFRNRLVWRSSHKNVAGRLSLRLLAPQFLVLVLSLTAVAVGFHRLEGRYAPGPLVAAVTDRLPDGSRIAEATAAISDFAAGTADRVAALFEAPPPAGQQVQGPQAPPPPAAADPAPADAPPLSAPAATLEAAVPPATIREAPAAADPAPAAGEVPPAPPVASPERPAPRPIDWFEPLTKGYTIDLVLIAGFWALFNALRVIFVFAKVTGNARETRGEYMFRTLAPLRVERRAGPAYLVVEKLSPGTAVVTGDFSGITETELLDGLKGCVTFPTGAARLTLLPEDEVRRPPRRGARMRFRIEASDEEARAALERGLYATSWHRECNRHDAEFRTPLGTIAGLLGRGRVDRQPWQAALVTGEPGAEPAVALYRRSGGLVLLADAEPGNGVAQIITIDRAGWQTRRLLLRELLAGEPFRASVPTDLQLFRYRFEEVPGAGNIAVLRRRAAPPLPAAVPADRVGAV